MIKTTFSFTFPSYCACKATTHLYIKYLNAQCLVSGRCWPKRYAKVTMSNSEELAGPFMVQVFTVIFFLHFGSESLRYNANTSATCAAAY